LGGPTTDVFLNRGSLPVNALSQINTKVENSKETTPILKNPGEKSPLSVHEGATSRELMYLRNSPRHTSVLGNKRIASVMDKSGIKSPDNNSEEDDDPAESGINQKN
jgi:hypothetical protein